MGYSPWSREESDTKVVQENESISKESFYGQLNRQGQDIH